jgi:hypothetical protein
MSDVAVVLRKARDLYAANPSHAPFPLLPPRGTYCAVLAIYRAPGSINEHLEAEQTLTDVAGGRDLIDWNAENSTETVLAAFDKAITEADNA